MKWLLVLLILAAAAGAGYEYQLQQQHTADYVRQRADLMGRLEKLAQENRRIQDERDGHAQDLAAMQSQADSLRAQIQKAEAKRAVPAPVSAPVAPPPPVTPALIPPAPAAAPPGRATTASNLPPITSALATIASSTVATNPLAGLSIPGAEEEAKPDHVVLPPSDRTFNVKDYGAKADGETDDEPAIQAAIEAAVKAGPDNTVYIPAGKYCLSSAGPDRAFYFRIPPGAVNLTITGDTTGTLLLSAGGHYPFVVIGCTNCKIENLTIDFKILNVTQGTIAAVDSSGKTVTVKIDPGYQPPDAPVFTAQDRYTPRFDVLSVGRDTFDSEKQSAIVSVASSGEQWTIEVDRALEQDDVGKRFFVWGNQQDAWGKFVAIQGCNNFSVENITDYAGGGFAGGGASTGTLSFTNFYCGPPPGSNRLGFYGGHQGHTRANVVMTNCQFLMSNDDDMNELTVLDHILAQPEPDTIEVRRTPDYEVGDTVSIWDYTDPAAVHVRESAVIKRIEPNSNGTMDLTLDSAVVVAKTGVGKPPPYSKTDGIDRVVDITSGGHFTLTNCSFSSSFAHPLLLKTANGIDMEGCRIYGSDMSGLDCGMQTYWNEGPQTCNVTVKNNTFYDIDGISCSIGIEAGTGLSSGSHDQQNIDIENNVFLSGGNHDVWNGITPRGIAILIGDVHQAVVKNNLIAGFPNANILVYSSDHVSIDGNIFLDANKADNKSNNWTGSVDVDPSSVISISNASDVALSGNLVFNEGTFGKKLVSVGAGTSAVTGADTGIARADPVVSQAADAVTQNAHLNPQGDPGGGYVTGITGPDSSVTFPATVPDAGRYPVVITYNNPSTDANGYGVTATQDIIVNGDNNSPVTVTYPFTGSWGAFNPAFKAIAWVNLKAGANTLSFHHATHSVDLHDIVVPVAAAGP